MSLKYSSAASEIKIERYTGTGSSLEIPSRIDRLPVTQIGTAAFANCVSLVSIRIPDSVKEIEDGVFTGCTSLKFIDSPLIPFFKDADFIYRKMDDSSVYVDGFVGKKSEIIVPDHVKNFAVVKIGRCAFVENKTLETITIPDTVKMIGDGAFEACSSLKAISLPKSVSKIGASAFYACMSLKSIVVPNSVTTINSGTFSECTSLETITIPDSVETIGDYAFEECSSLKEIILPDSVKAINYGAFTGCTALEFIIIPDSVMKLFNTPFVRCNKLTDIYLPETLSHGLEVEEFFSELCNDNNCNVHFYTIPYPIFFRIISLKKERTLSLDVSDWLTQIERLMEANVSIDERVKNSVMTILNDIEKIHRLQGKIRTNSIFYLILLLNEVVENKTVNAVKYKQRYIDDIAELKVRVKENLGALFVEQNV